MPEKEFDPDQALATFVQVHDFSNNKAEEKTRIRQSSNPSDWYNSDTAFKNLVDHMEVHMQQANFTPSEMRIAAILASIHFESHRIRRSLTTGDLRFGLYEGLNDLHEKMNDLIKADGL